MNEEIHTANALLVSAITRVQSAGEKASGLLSVLLVSIASVLDLIQKQISEIEHRPTKKPIMKITYSYTFHYDAGEDHRPTIVFNYMDEQVERDKILKHANSVGHNKGWGNALKVEETIRITSEVV